MLCILRSSWHGKSKQWWGQWCVKGVTGVKQFPVNGWLISLWTPWEVNNVPDNGPRGPSQPRELFFTLDFYVDLISLEPLREKKDFNKIITHCNIPPCLGKTFAAVRMGHPGLITRGVGIVLVWWMQPPPQAHSLQKCAPSSLLPNLSLRPEPLCDDGWCMAFRPS